MRYLTANQERARDRARAEIDRAAVYWKAMAALVDIGDNRLGPEIERLALIAAETESDAYHAAGAAGLDLGDL